MKTTTIRITDEERQRIKDLRYHKDVTLRQIFLAGLEAMEKPVAIPHG